MKQVVFAIFAHPDDETLVAGSLLKLAAEGADVTLVSVTSGDAGNNPTKTPDLAALRLSEWRRSAKILHADTFPLHYPDGRLQSTDVPQLEEAIAALVRSKQNTTKVTFITFDEDGVTGHPDHKIVHTVVHQLASQFHATARYFRLTKEHARQGPGTAEYPLAGYDMSEIDQVVDVGEFVALKLAMMDCHESQKSDMAKWKQCDMALLRKECFRVETY